jgi:hypothetical protein
MKEINMEVLVRIVVGVILFLISIPAAIFVTALVLLVIEKLGLVALEVSNAQKIADWINKRIGGKDERD